MFPAIPSRLALLPLTFALFLTAPAAAQYIPAPTATTLFSTPVMALLTPDEVLELMEGGQLQEAEAAARRAAAARPESARARVVLARILARQERLDEARSVLEEAKALPQWDEENISVPFESPRTIDRTMQRDPQKALGLIADVLLAEGDDPKAYYLQSLAYVQLANYGAAQLALNKAKEHGDVADFAHPDTLARLEQLLRDRPTEAQPAGKTSFQNEAALTAGGTAGSTQGSSEKTDGGWPWYVWAIAGTIGGGLGLGIHSFRKWSAEEEAKRAALEARLQVERRDAARQAYAELDKQLAQTNQELARQGYSPELARRLERLNHLRGQVGGWENTPFKSGPNLTAEFGVLLAASQTDLSWQAYQDELAREAAEEAAREAAEAEQERLHRQRERSESSSFQSGDDDSWSSGSSSSSGGNNGGSSW